MVNAVNQKHLLTTVDKPDTHKEQHPMGIPLLMKKPFRINPIAKILPKFGKQVIPDKRNTCKNKQAKKDIRDGKTGNN